MENEQIPLRSTGEISMVYPNGSLTTDHVYRRKGSLCCWRLSSMIKSLQAHDLFVFLFYFIFFGGNVVPINTNHLTYSASREDPSLSVGRYYNKSCLRVNLIGFFPPLLGGNAKLSISAETSDTSPVVVLYLYFHDEWI